MVCVKWRVFSKQQIVRSKFNLPAIFLVTFKELLVLKNKLNYTQTNIGAKLKHPQPSFLIVLSNQMLNWLRFVQDCGVCVNIKENTS